VVNAFLSDVARLLPNLESLRIFNNRRYYSQRELKGGAVKAENPLLSGGVSFPNLKNLSLSGLNIIKPVKYKPRFYHPSLSGLSAISSAAPASTSGAQGEDEGPLPIPLALDAPVLEKLVLGDWAHGVVKPNEEDRGKHPHQLLVEILRLAPKCEVTGTACFGWRNNF